MSSNQERPTPRNPLAPLPAEREEICRLIKRDKTLVEFLIKEKEERDIIVAQYESKEAKAVDCLSAINADLARATQLHGILMEALKNIEEFDDSLGTKASASHSPHGAGHLLPNLADRMPISRIANEYYRATKERLLEIEAAIEKATSTASHYRQEVRAAKSLISMTRDGITSIYDQINKRKAAISVKKLGLDAIWCIPDEIWGLIFRHSTGTTNASIRSSDDWVRGDTSWRGALVISGVCQRWQYIAVAVPKLWANITIFREAWRMHDLGRVQLYMERAGDSAKTLLLGGTLRPSVDQLRGLRAVVGKCTFLDRIICRLVRYHTNGGIAVVMDCLPSAPELWLLRDEPHTGASLESTPYHFISIPDSLSRGVERPVTKSTRVYWGSFDQAYPRLHSCSITCPSFYVGRGGDLFFPPSIGQFLFMRDVVVDHVAKTVLETLHADLQCLLVELAPADYDLSKARIPLRTLQFLTIESTTIVGPLLTLILDSTSLTSLELRGDSVDVILSSLVEDYRDKEKPFLSSLRRLAIDSYTGVGASVHEFLLAWKASQVANPCPLELVLFADECPSVTLETRKQLCSLAGGVL